MPSSTSIAYRRERMPRPLSVRSSSAPIDCAHAAGNFFAELLSTCKRASRGVLVALYQKQPELCCSLGGCTEGRC